MKRLSTLLTVLAFLCYGIAQAQSGSLDLSFDPGTGADGYVFTTTYQPDGKIIIGGEFTSYNGAGRNYITRLNTNGTNDLSFALGAGAEATIWTTALQTDGKIIIGGDFTSYNGWATNFVARLKADGTIDPTFATGSGFDAAPLATAIQPDGKLIIAGEFWFYDGSSRSHIVRINPNGSLDTSFDPGTGTSEDIRTICLQPDGKIIIGGNFTSYNGTGRNYIARLNANGSIDTSFDPGTGTDAPVMATVLQSDGKIIIGGGFNWYNGTARSHVARLNTNGSLDTSFDPAFGPDWNVFSAILQPDGKLIIGGSFITYTGISRKHIARVNTDGSLDFSFDPQGGANGFNITTTCLQADGKIIIGGDFTYYNGTARNYIARIMGNPVGIQEVIEKNSIGVYPNPTNGVFTIQGAKGEIEVYDLFGRTVLTTTKPEIDMRGYAKGVHFIKVGEVVRKLVLQ